MCGGLLQGKAWNYISQGAYAGLTIFASVCIRWYGRQLITITSLSATVPSKKQLSGFGACSLIGVASSSNCLSVSVCPVVLLNFPMIPSSKSSNGTTDGIATSAAMHWQVL